MVLKEFIFQNFYYFVSGVALTSALITYLYFYNREVLSFNSDQKDKLETTLELNTSGESQRIIVDLSGAVDRPGIYSLSPGDRLADLISLSGGVTSEVSKKWLSHNLNLSMVLKDQQKIYIPFEWEVAPEPPQYEIKKLNLISSETLISDSVEEKTVEKTPTSDENKSVSISEEVLVNINTASKEELIKLPRVGEVTADKIIKNRPYENLEDVAEKTDIYESTLEKIRELIIF